MGEAQSEVERGHRDLIERDRSIGLQAEADAARAHAAHVESRLAAAEQRLARKNDRIKRLTLRVAELEAGATAATSRGEARKQRRGIRRRLG